VLFVDSNFKTILCYFIENKQAKNMDMSCNTKKTVCMVFEPARKNALSLLNFLYLKSEKLL